MRRSGSPARTYIGCYTDPGADRDMAGGTIDPGTLTGAATPSGPSGRGSALVYGSSDGLDDVTVAETQSLCSAMCRGNGYQYMGLQWTNRCWCDNDFGSHGVATGCGTGGRNCGDGLLTCRNMNAVFELHTGDSVPFLVLNLSLLVDFHALLCLQETLCGIILKNCPHTPPRAPCASF